MVDGDNARESPTARTRSLLHDVDDVPHAAPDALHIAGIVTSTLLVLTTTSTSFSWTTLTMAFDLGTPVNTALLLYILYSIQRIIFPSNSVPQSVPNEFKNGYTWMPKSHPPTLLYQTYTPKTLEPFNGKDGKRILLAIKGVVYDVTAGRNFYGPGELPHRRLEGMRMR